MKVISLLVICMSIGLYYRKHIIANLSTLARQKFSAFKPYAQSVASHMSHNMSENSTNSSWVRLPLIPPEDPSLQASDEVATSRAVAKHFLAPSKSEGVGARVRRSIGVSELRNFTPFLMMDFFSVTPDSGFPDHPHRSMETITYLLSGSVDHEDFCGNKGTIGPGDLQFMTAGSGKFTPSKNRWVVGH